MIRSALIALGLSAGAASAQGFVTTAPLVDTCGGTRIMLRAEDGVRSANGANDLEAAASEVLSERLSDLFGKSFQYADVLDPSVDIPDRLIVLNLPSWYDASSPAIEPMLKQVDLGVFEVDRAVDTQNGATLESGQSFMPDAFDPVWSFVVNDTAILDGYAFEDAELIFDQNNRPAIGFRLSQDAARTFGEYTAEHIGDTFAISLRGEVITAPIIQSAIWGGSGMISGSFTVAEAEELAALIRSGVLPFGLDVVSSESVDGSDPSADFCP